MPVKVNNLASIENDFFISGEKLFKIMHDFHLEMINGLLGKPSSLKMIPSYVDKPTGNERGKFIALDLGGTNFRVLQVELKGSGKVISCDESKFVLKKRHASSTAEELFGFISGCIMSFCRKNNIPFNESREIGFTFSFPVEQSGIAKGRLLHWTKGFSASGVVKHDVVALLNAALVAQGLNNIKVVALVNDTVGTLVTQAYHDPLCSAGVILGTGTNACYLENVSEIPKWNGAKPGQKQVIVNIEWGNFNKLPLTVYDRILDRASNNPGEQILEKMVSGMYLGEISRLIINEMITRGMLLRNETSEVFEIPQGFRSEHMSLIEADKSSGLSSINAFLKDIGIRHAALGDRKMIKRICQIVGMRGARISAAALAAVIMKMDRTLKHKHTIAIDGSLYEKYPGFSRHLKSALKEIFAARTRNLKIVLSKDGSGKGAAIIAAIAALDP